jgi:glyoxylase-like metal-dependent hydrolase (beta-lactamase superfamily II)
MKRTLLIFGVVLVVLFGVFFATVGKEFVGMKPAADGPVAAGVQLVRDGYVNVFFIDVEGGVAMIDCGNDPEAKAILAALKARSLDANAVKAIFLTHGHPDHTAGCNQFTAPVYAFEADRGIAEGSVPANGPLPKLMGVQKGKTTKVTSLLVEGATVSFGDVGVTAWNIPGHTQGSAAYLARGVLFFGDSGGGQADGKLRPAPWVFSDDSEQNKASLKGLAAKVPAGVTRLAFAHSGFLEGADALSNFGK